ncbi:hypothetical protein ACIRD3_02055 [Kitasatospora sp. NPDC093550]|uniref:hypothetical protein n=1 Tax=Kitasatospora sp. NPDC093550 TaxID=3364089 RepID=UPI0038052C9C
MSSLSKEDRLTMPFAETPLRDEYAAAVQRVAGRTLDALRDGGGTAALTDPGTAAPRPLLAAARVLGGDLFAPQLLVGAEPDGATAALLAEARRALPAPVPASEEAALVIGWQDWAAARLLARTPYGDGGQPPAPPLRRSGPLSGMLSGPEALGWQAWSVRMAQLSVLTLPGLDGPVHDAARANTLDLARGTVRAMLRRDPATAVRLTRWLARVRADGRPVPLEVEPLLERIRLVGDGTARSELELAIAQRLLNGATR